MSSNRTFGSTIAVFVVFVALFTLTAGGHLYSPDEEIMFRTTEAIATRGSFSIEPIRDPASGRTFATRRGADNKSEYQQYGMGNSLFAVPFYYAGWLGTKLVSSKKAEELLDFQTASLSYLPEASPSRGHDLLLRFAVSFFGIFVAAATCALLWRFCFGLSEEEARQSSETSARDAEANGGAARRRMAWLVTLAYGAGTMAWPHSKTFFSEPLAAFFVFLAFYWTWRSRHLSVAAVALSGVAFALALFTRLDSVVVLPALALFVLLRYLELHGAPQGTFLQLDAKSALRLMNSGGVWRRVAAFGVPLAGFGLVQLGCNWAFYGHPLASGYSDQPEGIRFSTPLSAGLYGYFFSVGKSVFLFSPAILLGIFGFQAFCKRHFTLAVAVTAALLLLVLFHARWQNWAGGWCWGPRHLFMAHVFIMLPALGFVHALSRARKLFFGGIMAAAVYAQLFGCSQNFIDFYVLFYRTPHNPPLARVMYSPEDIAPALVQAPINDSIYVPQNSQWSLYAKMQELGYTDNLWLRLVRRAHDEERPLR